MGKIKRYENYPIKMVIISSLVTVGIYALGFMIIFRLGWVYSIVYLIYILVLEYRLLRYDCINCYYWGKSCCFARGRVSSWFFKKGDISEFCAKEMSWKKMIPDFLVSIIPFVTGIILLVIRFDLILLSALLLLVFLTTVGNAYIRGSMACKYCKQQEAGCLADLFFNKP